VRKHLIAHEAAHRWFGDLITMRWFDDVWTKEVFANFIAGKVIGPQSPQVRHDWRLLLAQFRLPPASE
jgi:aminopeptidase N